MSADRSDWEIAIEKYIRDEYPALRIETNNRSIIPSRRTLSRLEIDIFIPELSLGIEVNGEAYHHREKYRKDRLHATEYSDEMYKENYCRRVGIRLIHVWSSEDPKAIQSRLRDAIRRRLADPATKEWRRPTLSGRSRAWMGRLDGVDFFFVFVWCVPGVLMTWLMIAVGAGGMWLLWTWATVIATWIFYKLVYQRS